MKRFFFSFRFKNSLPFSNAKILPCIFFSTMDELAANISDDFAKSFEEYDCEDDDIIVYDGASEQKPTNPIIQMANEILIDRAKYNKSYAATSSYAQNLNSVPGALLKVPTTKQKLIREANPKYKYEHYIICDSCKVLIGDGNYCGNCDKITKKNKNNYFIYIPLLQQIENMLDRYLDIIVQSSENRQQTDSVISDISDSNVYKNIQAKAESKILLPFTMCTDGIKIFASSKSTLWPIQLTQGYLPPNIRYLKDNILLVGLYCGQEKPNMSIIMLPLAKELGSLKQKGIFMYRQNNIIEFSPTLMFCASDLPARAEIQNCKTFAGFYGCPCCKQEGVSVRNPKTGRSYVRYLKRTEPAQLRTHEDAIKLGLDVLSGREIINSSGLKGLSCMIAFKDFDLTNSYALDYMHGITLGIVPLLLDIWMGKKRLVYTENETHHFKPMTVKQRLELNRRIVGLKPVTRIRHKPRSILDRGFFTANEYRSLVFYYLRFALNGLLHRDLIKHFELLSEASYTLCKPRITKNEIHKANAKLHQFADQFEYFYGINSITMNIHLLRHYADSVLNTGPLWCHSMYSFESNNGEIKRSFNCTVDVVEQIAFNYSIKASNEVASCTHQPPTILRLKHKNIDHVSWKAELGLINHG